MSEKPILFSGPMIRAILDGRKTQTRRVASVPSWCTSVERVGEWFHFNGSHPDGKCEHPKCAHIEGLGMFTLKCPYGQLGDQLWVKETFAMPKWADPQRPRDCGKTYPLLYLADNSHGEFVRWNDVDEEVGKTRPSIFMPRWTSRITLEITSIRVERVTDISEEDAMAEGLLSDEFPIGGRPVTKYGMEGWQHRHWRQSPVDAFERLWDSINAKRGFGWDSSPWAWALTFQRTEAR